MFFTTTKKVYENAEANSMEYYIVLGSKEKADEDKGVVLANDLQNLSIYNTHCFHLDIMSLHEEEEWISSQQARTLYIY